MKYTKDNLHGIVYTHKAGVPTARIIKIEPSLHNGFEYTTCSIKTGVSDKPWFTPEQAVEWLEKGVWIAHKVPDEIINNYEIY